MSVENRDKNGVKTLLKLNMVKVRAKPSLGGYEDECVTAVEEDLQCPICQLPLKEPVQTEVCGHRFCKPCLDEHFTRLALVRFPIRDRARGGLGGL